MTMTMQVMMMMIRIYNKTESYDDDVKTNLQ